MFGKEKAEIRSRKSSPLDSIALLEKRRGTKIGKKGEKGRSKNKLNILLVVRTKHSKREM